MMEDNVENVGLNDQPPQKTFSTCITVLVVVFLCAFIILGLLPIPPWEMRRSPNLISSDNIIVIREKLFDECEKPTTDPTLPISLDIPLENGYCPIATKLTHGRVKNPYVAVYAVKYRDSDQWQRTELSSIPRFPIIFPLDACIYNLPAGKYRSEPIGFSDGGVSSELHPAVFGKTTLITGKGANSSIVTIQFHTIDDRVKYTKEISEMKGILVAPLDREPSE